MIRSGSLTPGIDPAMFRLPPGTAVRFERPAEPLRSLIPAYAVLASDPAVWAGQEEWVLPGSAQLWIVLTDRPVMARLRRRPPVQLGQSVVLGPTATAMPFTSRGGVAVMAELSPAGWARFCRMPASVAADRMVDADLVMGGTLGPGWAEALVSALYASDREEEVAPLMDRFFLDRLPPLSPDEADATGVAGALERDGLVLAQAAGQLGLSRSRIGRVSDRYLGHTPGVVRRRARLLRALTPALMGEAVMPTVPPGYHDAPHLGRDARDFLTMSAKRFLALPTPYLRAVLRARTAVIGAPLSVLDAG